MKLLWTLLEAWILFVFETLAMMVVEEFFQIFIMIPRCFFYVSCVGFSVDDDIITIVFGLDALNQVFNLVLENLRGAVDPKMKTVVLENSSMCTKCCYVFRVFTQFQLMVAIFKSILLNIIAPLRSLTKSSRVGVMCLSLCIALLAQLLSIQILISSFPFGMTTIGEIQDIGPSALRMMPRSCSLSSSFSTLPRSWKGILLWGCATGLTVLSI